MVKIVIPKGERCWFDTSPIQYCPFYQTDEWTDIECSIFDNENRCGFKHPRCLAREPVEVVFEEEFE